MKTFPKNYTEAEQITTGRKKMPVAIIPKT